MQAFLDTIAISEGTYGRGDRGYDVVVGGKLLKDYGKNYDDHPKVVVDLGRGLKSTAAGKYQILARYWDHYRKLLDLPDFSPESQDKVAIQMIREQKALEDVITGRFDSAIEKCRNIWASLEGAGYGQHENSLVKLRLWFTNSGGVCTDAGSQRNSPKRGSEV